MPRKNNKNPPKPQQRDEMLDDTLFYNSVASSSDTTGLIPALPETDLEADSYEEIVDIHKQKTDGNKKPNSDPR